MFENTQLLLGYSRVNANVVVSEQQPLATHTFPLWPGSTSTDLELQRRLSSRPPFRAWRWGLTQYAPF